MSFIRNTKIELVIFLIIALNIYQSFNIDLVINNYSIDINKSTSSAFLKEFFINITEIGNSFWFFGIIIFFFLMLRINNMFKFADIDGKHLLNNFFITSFFYLLISGIATQLVKHIVGRPRPNHTNFDNMFDFNYLTFDSSFHSFPSGHTSTIFMICFILCATFPKLKYLFYFLASVVSISRVVVGAHYFTDILGGILFSLIVFKILNFFVNKNFKDYRLNEFVFSNHSTFSHWIIFLACCCLFLTVGPSIDLYVSSLFYENYEFYLQKYNALSKIFREGFLPIVIVYILILPIVGLYFKIDKIFFGYKFSIKDIVLIWSSQIFTILIFVNLILKNMWGRARPNDVFQFGGSDLFTPWYQFSNACSNNCSFVSGDASVGFSLIVFYFITKKIYFVHLSILSGFVLGLIRIVAGGHFLSDILFAGFFIFLLNLVIFSFFKRHYEQ